MQPLWCSYIVFKHSLVYIQRLVVIICLFTHFSLYKYKYFQEFSTLKEEFLEKFGDDRDGDFNGLSRASESEELQQLKVSISSVIKLRYVMY